MTPLQEVQELLGGMIRAEKTSFLQNVMCDPGTAYPGLESREEVCGGEPCMVRTRMPVWLLFRMRQTGVSEADILRSYPTLSAEDLSNAWHYSRAHREEIEAQIHANEEA